MSELTPGEHLAEARQLVLRVEQLIRQALPPRHPQATAICLHLNCLHRRLGSALTLMEGRP